MIRMVTFLRASAAALESQHNANVRCTENDPFEESRLPMTQNRPQALISPNAPPTLPARFLKET